MNKTSNILIGLLIIAILFILLPTKWSKFFTNTTELQNENVRLNEQINQKEVQISYLREKNRIDSLKLLDLQKEFFKIDSLTILKEIEIMEQQNKINEFRKEYLEVLTRVEYIKNNPSNKRGEELLYSIKNKIQR